MRIDGGSMNISRTPGIYSYPAPEYSNRALGPIDPIRADVSGGFRGSNLERAVALAERADRVEIRSRPDVQERMNRLIPMNRPEEMSRFTNSNLDPAVAVGSVQDENPVRSPGSGRVRSMLFRSAGEEATPGLFINIRA